MLHNANTYLAAALCIRVFDQSKICGRRGGGGAFGGAGRSLEEWLWVVSASRWLHGFPLLFLLYKASESVLSQQQKGWENCSLVVIPGSAPAEEVC